MPPAARLSLSFARYLPNLAPMSMGPPTFRVQGWDPVLIISQIVSLQALHYLSLSLLLPPLLTLFASPTLLSYEGGPSSVSMIMDWREFVGLSTVSIAAGNGMPGGLMGVAAARAAREAGSRAALKKALAAEVTVGDLTMGLVRIVESDPMRGWVVALGWILASLIDVVYLYHLVRRPTHILDFSLTLVFNHLILTTYYASSFPTSLFFWFIIGISTVAQVVLAEQCCVARDMHEGFTVVQPDQGSPRFGSPYMGTTPGDRTGNSLGVGVSTLGPGNGNEEATTRGKEDIELSAMSAVGKHHAKMSSLGGGSSSSGGSSNSAGGARHSKGSSLSSVLGGLVAAGPGGTGTSGQPGRYQPIPSLDERDGT